MKGYMIVAVSLPALIFAGCSPVAHPVPAEKSEVPPVYVTVAGHIEDTPIYTDCKAYPDLREKLLMFAETISKTGAAVNLQIDYEFLVGVSQCETDAMRENTDGQNVIEYLVKHYGFEIDPHQEGGWEEGRDNYADVRYLGGELTPSISENVGGLVWDSPQQFGRLSNGESGRIYTDFTWHPEVLTLAVSHQHHQGDFSRDDVASGIWIPKGANRNFWIHDTGGHMAYVGPGEHTNWNEDRPYQSTPEFVETLAEQLEDGLIDRDMMYTASIAVPQSVIFDAGEHQRLLDLLEQLTSLIESGQARYVTYSQAVDIWRNEYDSQPNIFFQEGVQPPADSIANPADEEAPLYLTTMTHMEGSFKDDQNEEIFQIHVNQLRYGLEMASEYGAKLTIESEMPFALACEKWQLNMMQEVLDRGHGVGTHCDVGFQYTPASPGELAELYQERKHLVDVLVGPENNRGYSGGGSEQDWILAAREAGFSYKDGGVGMLYLSMPIENRPGPEWTDEYIRTEAFHEPAPVSLEDRIYPFMMKDALDFVPDEDGKVLFSSGGIGRLDAMEEGKPTECPNQNCPFTEDDVRLIVEKIEEVDSIRDPDKLAKVDIYIPVKLFDEKYDAVWHSFFESMQILEEQGIITWATQGEVYDAYIARYGG